MREATGGLLLLDLVVFILFVFVFFIASFMQYTRTYKIKGNVINAIERAEGGIASQEEFEEVLKAAGYYGPYVFCKHMNVGNRGQGSYFTVQLNAYFTILPQYFSIRVPVQGETRTINTGIFYKQTASDFQKAFPKAVCPDLGGGSSGGKVAGIKVDGSVCCVQVTESELK